MSTDLLDRYLQQRRDRLEQERQLSVQKAMQWLDQHGAEHGIQKAYIFGSASRLGRFRDDSDVDIAVEQVNPTTYFVAISLLSTWLERDVDLIELEKCPFQHRIRESGLVWTAQTN